MSTVPAPKFSGERQPFIRRGDQFVALDKSRLVRASGGWVQMVNDKPWVFVPSADIVWIPSNPKMREQADG